MSEPKQSGGLVALLEEARSLGFLGPGPVEAHLAHAEGYLQAVPRPPARAVDLGTGGGVPGLVLAWRWPETEVLLVDSHRRRCAFLKRACANLHSTASVLCARAEEIGRDPRWRGSADLVTARSFGPPPVTAECGAPCLAVGGRLVVSDPPDQAPQRWPEDGVAKLGLRLDNAYEAAGGHFQVLVQASPCPGKYPRRVGIPAKRPLW